MEMMRNVQGAKWHAHCAPCTWSVISICVHIFKASRCVLVRRNVCNTSEVGVAELVTAAVSDQWIAITDIVESLPQIGGWAYRVAMGVTDSEVGDHWWPIPKLPIGRASAREDLDVSLPGHVRVAVEPAEEPLPVWEPVTGRMRVYSEHIPGVGTSYGTEASIIKGRLRASYLPNGGAHHTISRGLDRKNPFLSACSLRALTAQSAAYSWILFSISSFAQQLSWLSNSLHTCGGIHPSGLREGRGGEVPLLGAYPVPMRAGYSTRILNNGTTATTKVRWVVRTETFTCALRGKALPVHIPEHLVREHANMR
eukprot:1034389-Prorocentrum_minimum.AAC.3